MTSSISISLPLQSDQPRKSAVPTLTQSLAQTISAIAAHTATEVAARKRLSRCHQDERDGRDEWALPSYTTDPPCLDEKEQGKSDRRKRRKEKCPKCPVTGRKLERNAEKKGPARYTPSPEVEEEAADARQESDRGRRSPSTAQTSPSATPEPIDELFSSDKRASVQLYAKMLASVQAQHLALLLRGEGERDFEDEREVVRIRGLRDELLEIQRGMLEGIDGDAEEYGGKAGMVMGMGREESAGGCWRNFRAGNRTKIVC